MAFEHRAPYVTDVENYAGPMDRVSPYHYYQFTYWKLRGYWRNVLYAWTRREPCDATAAIARLELIRNGAVVHTVTPSDTDDASLEWEDERTVAEVALPRALSETSLAYYYLRVATVNGDFGWCSPIWVREA